MDDEFEALTEDLLKEFQRLGQEYPLLTKMFMDMTAIVSNHNKQLEELTAVCEDTTGAMESMVASIKDHSWKLGILKKNALGDSGLFPGKIQKRDKDLLN